MDQLQVLRWLLARCCRPGYAFPMDVELEVLSQADQWLRAGHSGLPLRVQVQVHQNVLHSHLQARFLFPLDVLLEMRHQPCSAASVHSLFGSLRLNLVWVRAWLGRFASAEYLRRIVVQNSRIPLQLVLVPLGAYLNRMVYFASVEYLRCIVVPVELVLASSPAEERFLVEKETIQFFHGNTILVLVEDGMGLLDRDRGTSVVLEEPVEHMDCNALVVAYLDHLETHHCACFLDT